MESQFLNLEVRDLIFIAVCKLYNYASFTGNDLLYSVKGGSVCLLVLSYSMQKV